MQAESPVLEIKNVSKIFSSRADLATRLAARLTGREPSKGVQALNDVSLSLAPGEVVGLVGESGCGKSTLGRIAAGILSPSTGKVMFHGRDTASLKSTDRVGAAVAVQMVFQDPFSSLNPRMRIGDILSEAPVVHGLWSAARAREHVAETLSRVGLDPSVQDRFPHQFSGGQRQRIGIARALAVSPQVLICDEAVASLDVSIQAQMLNLFLDLRQSLGLSWLFISHDLGVVRHIADRVAIMYLGRIVEEGPTEAVFANPKHPYTRGLLDSVPRIDARRVAFRGIKGEIPSPLSPPSGCHFHPRCQFVTDRCRSQSPDLRPLSSTRSAACHHAEDMPKRTDIVAQERLEPG